MARKAEIFSGNILDMTNLLWCYIENIWYVSKHIKILNLIQATDRRHAIIYGT